MRRGSLLLGFLIATAAGLAAWTQAPPNLIQIDRRARIARADLDYDTPATRSEEGMPIGTGRTGGLVWTTPSALHTQINRVDVHAMDSTSFSFPRADSDYGYGCGAIDINLASAGPDVFSGAPFHQHLSLYDGLMTLRGNDVSARAFAWPLGDVLVVNIDDQRANPEPITVDLRMLRYQRQYVNGQSAALERQHSVVFRTAAHTATSTLGIDNANRITLTQQFKEGDFYDASGVAISVRGRPVRARFLNDTTVQVAAAAGHGRLTILISSAATNQPTQDAAALAIAQLAAAERDDVAALERATAGWWSTFWSKATLDLHSASGQADVIEANYDYFLYLMGASSGGAFPPRFGGLLWNTDGDLSRWGSQYWWANTSAYYSNLMPANRIDLMDPMFKLYEGMYDAAALAARQQWGAEGLWIPETTFFNGPEALPDDIARELQDLMLVRKPWEQRSQKFDWFANNKNRHNSRWNFHDDGEWDHGYYTFTSKGMGVFGHTTHILGVASRIGNLAWQRYQLTGDLAWFREHGYRFIRGAAEFYRTFPNLQKDEAGVYHINHTNSGESAWDSRDAGYEIACMHMIFPLAVRASEVVGADVSLRPAWQEINAHLVAMPAGARCGTGSEIADNRPYGAFVYDGPGAIEPIGPEPELKQRFLGFTRLGSFVDATGGGGAQIFRNRLRLREGPGAIDAEHIAGLASGLHATLLNSHPEAVTDEPMTLFSRWPKDWDAAFSLLARGNLMVSAAQQNGAIPFVEVVSHSGAAARLTNPWPGQTATVFRNGRKAGNVSGAVLTVATSKDETVVLTPSGTFPTPVVVK